LLHHAGAYIILVVECIFFLFNISSWCVSIYFCSSFLCINMNRNNRKEQEKEENGKERKEPKPSSQPTLPLFPFLGPGSRGPAVAASLPPSRGPTRPRWHIPPRGLAHQLRCSHVPQCARPTLAPPRVPNSRSPPSGPPVCSSPTPKP
jgi:hypothetical protein